MQHEMFFFRGSAVFFFVFWGVLQNETRLSEKILNRGSLIIVTIVYGFSRLLVAEDSVEKCTESSNAIAETRHLYKEKINSAMIVGCFNGMIPHLYIENGCFTKHPFINGCLGFQVYTIRIQIVDRAPMALESPGSNRGKIFRITGWLLRSDLDIKSHLRLGKSLKSNCYPKAPRLKKHIYNNQSRLIFSIWDWLVPKIKRQIQLFQSIL